MQKIRRPKKNTKSLRSQSTKKSKEYTRTFKIPHKIKTNSHKAIVEGFSMWPSLRSGYVVEYLPCDPESLNLGEIIVMAGKGRRGEPHLRVHRYLGRVGPYFLEAGDNTFFASLIHVDSIKGKVNLVWDASGREVPLSELKWTQNHRFRVFKYLAHLFMYVHDAKDRVVGDRKSYTLWKISQVYRTGLLGLGLNVPPIPPR